MAVDRETFEEANEEELEDVSVPDRILGFLAANNDLAFKAREIAARTDLDDGAVSTALSRLKTRGLVEHRGTYWAIYTEDDRLASYSGYERATRLFNEQFGEETKDTWREHAPEEPHPSEGTET